MAESSSVTNLGHRVGSPVDPDENAIMSHEDSEPPRQREARGYALM